MKRNKKYFVNALLLVFVISGFTRCTSKSDDKAISPTTPANTTEKTEPAANTTNEIAYINIDTLLHNYQYAKDLNESFVQMTANNQSVFEAKNKEFQKMIQEYQHKVKNNAFLSPEAQQSSYEALGKKESELRELQERQNQSLVLENRRSADLILKKVSSFLKEYNKEKKYKVIFSTISNDNILLADPQCDITEEVTRMLNAEYLKEK